MGRTRGLRASQAGTVVKMGIAAGLVVLLIGHLSGWRQAQATTSGETATGVLSAAVDDTPPVLEGARTDTAGENVILTFSEDIFVAPLGWYVSEYFEAAVSDIIKAVMTVTVEGRPDIIFWASISGRELTLKLHAPVITSGHAVQVAYDNIFAHNSGGLLVDAAGNAVDFFSDQTVQNNSSVPFEADNVGKVILTPSDSTVNEGTTVTYGVTLDWQPSNDVTIDILTFPVRPVGVNTTTLTFTSENWNTAQTVEVETVDDGDSVDAWAVAVHRIRGVSSSRFASFLRILVVDQDTPLVVSGATSVDYTENTTNDVATYAVEGNSTVEEWLVLGEDSAAFSISSDGVLSFSNAPDYEDPEDADGDNVYTVMVHADDGDSTGALFDVVVNVTDVLEPPAAPGVFSVLATRGTTDSLTVRWTAPSNAGKPDITGYTLQYREGDSGVWENWDQSGTNTQARITGLKKDTTYQVRVAAGNEDGMGPWSELGAGRTNAVAGRSPAPGQGGGGDGGDEAEVGGRDEPPPTASSVFDDIDPGVWFEQAVTWMVLNDVTSGCAAGRFCPGADLTRQQFVTFLWRAAGRPTAPYLGSAAFADVPEGGYAEQSIGWAVANDVTRGCTTGEFGDPGWQFCPTRPVTRGQMAALLYRHVEADYVGAGSSYHDVASDRFYAAGIAWLTDFEVVPGCESNLFCPNRNATRAEAAVFINGVAIRPQLWGPGNTGFIPQPQ